MAMRKSPFVSSGLMLALAMVRCGGGGGGSTAIPTAIVESPDEKAMTSVETLLTSVRNQSMAVQASSLLAAMRGNSQFKASGISSDNTVWGIFKDGVNYLVPLTDPDLMAVTGGQTSASGPAHSSLDLTRTRTAAASAGDPPRPNAKAGLVNLETVHSPAAGEVPGSPTAELFTAFETNRNAPGDYIAACLGSAGYNWTTAYGSLDEWKTLEDCGLLMYAGHGAIAPIDDGGPEYYFLESHLYQDGDGTYASTTGGTGLQPGLAIGTVAVLDAPLARDSGDIPFHYERHYFFNSKWLPSKTMFAKNSIFFSLACSGTSDAGIAFANALAQRGLSLYGGWSNEVKSLDANETASYFFDRALGRNKFEPSGTAILIPDDWADILSTMHATNRAEIPDYNLDSSIIDDIDSIFSFKNYATPNSSMTTIIPAISSTQFDSINNIITIQGSFGSEPGLVTYGGDPLSIQSWTSSTITAFPSNLVSAGLNVICDGSLKSNLIPFSPMSISISPSSITVAAGDTVTFTASEEGTPNVLNSGLTFEMTPNVSGLNQLSQTTVSWTAPYFENANVWQSTYTLIVYPSGIGQNANSMAKAVINVPCPWNGWVGNYTGTVDLVLQNVPPFITEYSNGDVISGTLTAVVAPNSGCMNPTISLFQGKLVYALNPWYFSTTDSNSLSTTGINDGGFYSGGYTDINSDNVLVGAGGLLGNLELGNGTVTCDGCTSGLALRSMLGDVMYEWSGAGTWSLTGPN